MPELQPGDLGGRLQIYWQIWIGSEMDAVLHPGFGMGLKLPITPSPHKFPNVSSRKYGTLIKKIGSCARLLQESHGAKIWNPGNIVGPFVTIL